MYRNVVTETAQTKSVRLKSPIPCDLTVAIIDKTSNGFNLCRHKNLQNYTNTV